MLLAYQVHVHVCIDFIWKMQRCVGLKDRLQLAITLEHYLFYLDEYIVLGPHFWRGGMSDKSVGHTLSISPLFNNG